MWGRCWDVVYIYVCINCSLSAVQSAAVVWPVLTVTLTTDTLCFSIQRAAVWVLDRYYSDFPVYNPALLNLPKSILSKKMTGFKVYSLDGKYSLVLALTSVFNPEVNRFFFNFRCCLLVYVRSRWLYSKNRKHKELLKLPVWVLMCSPIIPPSVLQKTPPITPQASPGPW